jgi:hypothetical protein
MTAKDSKLKELQERERWIREWAKLVDVDPKVLLPDSTQKDWRRSHDSGLALLDEEDEISEHDDEDTAEEGEWMGSSLPVGSLACV